MTTHESKCSSPALIDVSFDVRTDTPPGKDPDTFSATLRRYHRLLWSKPLPCGSTFDLVDNVSSRYLSHQSPLGDFCLASDTVIPSFRKERSLQNVYQDIPDEERTAFARITYTVGGTIVFPGNRFDRRMTINGARGFHPRIKDRFDLTLECIRRYYCREPSPLGDVLARYGGFFDLFQSFHGYVHHFLLQDLVTADGAAVRFMMPFDNFTASPLPRSAASYQDYCERAVEFVKARNARIEAIASRVT